MFVYMNISDFTQRSNPEDMEDFLEGNTPLKDQNEPTDKQEKTVSKTTKASVSRIYTIITVVVLSALASLGLGILAGHGSGGATGLVVSSIPMTHPSTSILSASALDASSIGTSSELNSIPSGGEVIASKTSHTYYLPWCTQVGQITKEDEIVFATEQDAKTAGFTPGAGCKGI